MGASEPTVPIHECDRRAAHPSDSQRVVEPPRDWFMASGKAVAACRAALAAYPDSTRFKFQLGYLLSANDQHQEAFELIRSAAEQGYAAAMYDLANAFKFGRHVKKDSVKAIVWLRNAARHSNSWAEYDLGLMYLLGDGVNEDTGKTLMWLKRSANNGFDVAQFFLGSLYFNNFGIKIGTHAWPFNRDNGVKWFWKSAAQGNGYAQFSLGMLYAGGQGLPNDPEKSKEWIDRAKRNGVSGVEVKEFLSAPLTAETAPVILMALRQFSGEDPI